MSILYVRTVELHQVNQSRKKYLIFMICYLYLQHSIRLKLNIYVIIK